jgi:hypothetical protein
LAPLSITALRGGITLRGETALETRGRKQLTLASSPGYSRDMDVELTPEQPPAVVEAIEALVVPPAPEPDPWWRAGLEEALQT